MCRKPIPADSVVDTALRRFKRTVPRRVLAHTRHCFTVLRYHLRCLIHGLDVLSSTLLPSLTKHPAALQHVFTQMLRLHDGYILCVSGECRHEGDVQTKPKFPSRLAEHTGVYHASRTYSGTGWDEWNDPVVGLRTQGDFDDDEIWDMTVVQDTEQQMQKWQGDFRQVKDQLKQRLTKLFYPATVSVSWNDKMEQIKIQSVLQLERYGSNFQINGESVIPEDWSRCMRWPEGVIAVPATAGARKKKRIICDDDDEGEEAKPVASGLVVKEVVAPKPPSDQREISINAIKQHLGVDIAQLENARNALEAEEAETRKEAELLDAELNATERQIRKKYKSLKRLLLSPGADPALLWNARELLREEYMQAGDLLLWNNPVAARRYFEQASALVKSQSADDAFLKQNLRVLQAQAKINIGISLIQIAENSPAKAGHKDRASTLREACSVFNEVLQILKGDCAVNIQQLVSLALRWKGTALWYMYNRKEAEVVLLSASATYKRAADDVREAALACKLENFHALTSLTDLTLESLERATIQSMRDNKDFYRDIFDTSVRTMENAIAFAKDFHNTCTEDERQWLHDDGMSSVHALRESLQEIKTWWKQRLNLAIQALPVGDRVVRDRNDLESSCTPMLHRVGIPYQQRRKQRSQYNLGGSSNSRQLSATNPNTAPQQPTPRVQYSKWREDMVWVTDENARKHLVPKLEYPSIAPPMPPSIAAMLARRAR